MARKRPSPSPMVRPMGWSRVSSPVIWPVRIAWRTGSGPARSSSMNGSPAASQRPSVGSGSRASGARRALKRFTTMCGPRTSRSRSVPDVPRGSKGPDDAFAAKVLKRERRKLGMRREARAVVIGGGVIGCSILYHLTKLGWSDVLLLERDELTSGSTWHAAANIHGLHDNTNISRLQHYTMSLYKELEKETGQGCGVFQPGSLYLAQTEEREHQLRLQAAKARLYGMKFFEISIEEARRLHPLVNFEGVRCVMYEPEGGNVDPSGVTNAYAVAARQRGAEIHRFTPVTATEQQGDGSWIVSTPKGEIRTQWIVNAAGLWGREVAALAGVELPLIPTEHQYFVTERIAEVAALDRRLPSVSDRDGEYYLRQEGDGLLIGAYEKSMKFWAEEGTPLDFAHDLFPDDLERIEENVMRAIERVPCLGEAGIKRVINGPMIWSPDSNVLMGPVPELEGYFCCNGIIPGFSQSGGIGLMAAQWIVEGEPRYDLFPWDLARFGSWATPAFTRARVADQYSHRFAIH